MDKNLNPLAPGVADSEFIVELLNKLGIITRLPNGGTFDKDYVCGRLRLGNGNQPLIAKGKMAKIFKSKGKDFLKRLQKWICRFGLYDLNNFTRTRVEDYVCRMF